MPKGDENMDAAHPRRGSPELQQLALFAPEDLAPAEAPDRPAKRLSRPLKAFLDALDKPARKRRSRKDAAPASDQSTADWLESFFDVTRGP